MKNSRSKVSISKNAFRKNKCYRIKCIASIVNKQIEQETQKNKCKKNAIISYRWYAKMLLLHTFVFIFMVMLMHLNILQQTNFTPEYCILYDILRKQQTYLNVDDNKTNNEQTKN